MYCKCGSRFKVRNSRNSNDEKNIKFIPLRLLSSGFQITYRDGKCENCGETFQTVEGFIDSSIDIEEMVHARVKEVLEKLASNFTTVKNDANKG